MDDLSALEQVQCSDCCSTVVIALGTCPLPGDHGLEVIRNLKQKGFTVISCEDGALSWPIGARCRALLAGASWILDSAKAEFAAELRNILERSARAEAVRLTEEEGIKQTMRKLGMVGDSQVMMSVFRQMFAISALSDLPTLITGETGTGKELLARALHHLDRKRCNGPFVAVNCGAISAGLAESELFGHRRGAFTGAERERKGLIRAADGGVLFLDEIGELDDALQVKLLRVLQERQVLSVGEDTEVAVSVRIIAATNRDLAAMVRQKQFRADLFHRLHVLSIHLPPLRERPTDLQPLVEYLVQKNQSLKPSNSLTVSPAFVEALMQIELPGNVRQLENLIQSVLVNKEDDAPLDLQHLPPEIWRQLVEQSERLGESSEQSSDQKSGLQPSVEPPLHTLSAHLVKLLTANRWKLVEALRYCERILLEGALRLNHGNQSHTAQLLGITPRSVYSMIRRHGLSS
jgi:transcriptional regulator with GAF, ATPase, and Fis domain